jgi:hypothetical protein
VYGQESCSLFLLVQQESSWQDAVISKRPRPTSLLLTCVFRFLSGVNRSVMEGFASSVLELQNVLKNPPPANAPPSFKSRCLLPSSPSHSCTVGESNCLPRSSMTFWSASKCSTSSCSPLTSPIGRLVSMKSVPTSSLFPPPHGPSSLVLTQRSSPRDQSSTRSTKSW